MKYSIRTFKFYHGEALDRARHIAKKLVTDIGIDIKSFRSSQLPPIEQLPGSAPKLNLNIPFVPNFSFYLNTELNLTMVRVWEPIVLKYSLFDDPDRSLGLDAFQSSSSESSESVFNPMGLHETSGIEEGSFSTHSQHILRQNTMNPYSLGT